MYEWIRWFQRRNSKLIVKESKHWSVYEHAHQLQDWGVIEMYFQRNHVN